MASKDTIKRTITVAVSLCVVCSVIVSTAAVVLRPAQEANKLTDKQTNILRAAGMYEEGKPVDELFAQVTAKLVDLRTGKFSEDLDASTYDQVKAAKDPSLSESLDADADIASISRREHYATVYVVESGNDIEKVILPIRGYGLWSTLKGFIALESDLNTVIGLGYYDHKETPGLGGEVDNPRWKSLWGGKSVYDDGGDVALRVVKGNVDTSAPQAEYQVDGLSGATLTSDGVTYMIQFWLGDSGYAPFLDNLKRGEA